MLSRLLKMHCQRVLQLLMATQLLEVLIARVLKTPLPRLFSAPC
jgi:hypothetical protein